MKKPRKQNPPQPGAASGGKPPEPATPAVVVASAAPRVVVTEAGDEPTVGRTSMPVLLIALLGGLLYWGNMFIVEHGGELDARVQGPYRTFKEIGDLQPKSEEQQLIARGLKVYNKPSCVACHQSDGNGSAALNAPPLVGSEWVLEKDPSRIIRIVLHGLSGPITVKGKPYGAVAMLSWKDILSDEEIADVLTYVRNSWGNKAPPVKAEQVKKIRDETKDHGGYMTVPDLEKVVLQK
jgi:mono/diheme cytochrome c family protein